MNAGTLANVIIGALSILAVLVLAVLGGVIRIVMRFASMEERISSLAAHIPSLRSDMDREHAEIYAVIREDRRSSNERLMRLESRAIGGSGQGM